MAKTKTPPAARERMHVAGPPETERRAKRIRRVQRCLRCDLIVVICGSGQEGSEVPLGSKVGDGCRDREQ